MKILTIALQKDGKLVSASLESIEAARSLGGELYTAILAADTSALADQLAAAGGGKVLAVANPALAMFNDQAYANVIGELIGKYTPDVVICPATNYGKALTARLAGKHGGRMASDVTNLAPDGEKVVATRPSYGGSVIAQVVATDGGPFFVTLRPKVYNEATGGDGEVVAETVGDAHCILYVDGLSFIDSAGLMVLLRLFKHTGRHGRRFVLCTPGPMVRRMLQVTKLERLFITAPDAAAVDTLLER